VAVGLMDADGRTDGRTTAWCHFSQAKCSHGEFTSPARI